MKSIITVLLIAMSLTVVEALAQTKASGDKNDPGLTQTGTTGAETAAAVVKPGLPCPPEICPQYTPQRSGYQPEHLIQPDERAQPAAPSKAGSGTRVE